MDVTINGIRDFVAGDLLHAVVAACIILIITGIGSAIVTRLIKRISRADQLDVPSSSILINIARVVIWGIGISIALSACFNVDVNGILAALGIGGVALSLGMQDTIKNFIGGLQVTIMKIVSPGDHVIVGTVEGIVEDVTWRHTVVHDFENVTHLIPNAVINSTAVSKIEPSKLVSTRLSFINDTQDLDGLIHEMEERAKVAVEQVAPLEKDPWILITEIGEYGTWAKMRFVLEDTANAREARDAALRAIAPYTRLNSTDILPEAKAD